MGQIDLTFNENNQLVDAQIEAIATNTLPQRKSDLVETNGWELRGHKLLEGTVVADLPKALPNVFPDFKGSHYLAKIFADYGNTKLCLMNSGLLVTDELPNHLTLDDLHEFLPHSIRLVRFTFTGEELRQVLLEIMDVSDFLATQKIQGMGFRGKTFGSLIFHGIEPREGDFYIKNSENQSLEKISDEESYQIVLPDQYLFAWYFPLLKKLGKSEILFPYFLREIVAEHFKNK